MPCFGRYAPGVSCKLRFLLFANIHFPGQRPPIKKSNAWSFSALCFQVSFPSLAPIFLYLTLYAENSPPLLGLNIICN